MSIIPTFILLGGLILWFVIGTKGYWPLKMILITMTVCFSLFLSQTMQDVRGWPTDDALPDKFRVHWIVVKEPDKADRDNKGGIYLWVTDLSGDGSQPRSYRSEYSRKKHEDAQEALGMIMNGKAVGGRRGEGEGGGDNKGDGDQKGEGQDGGDGAGSMSNSPEIIFHELPPPKPPKKD